MAVLLENYETVNSIIAGIRKCTSKAELEKVFSGHAQIDFKQRKGILEKAMGIEESYNAPTNDDLSDEDEYQYMVDVFMDGSWRLFSYE